MGIARQNQVLLEKFHQLHELSRLYARYVLSSVSGRLVVRSDPFFAPHLTLTLDRIPPNGRGTIRFNYSSFTLAAGGLEMTASAGWLC